MAFEKLLGMFKDKLKTEPATPEAAAETAPISPPIDIAADLKPTPVPEPATPNPQPETLGPPPDLDTLREQIVQKIRTIYDPEIPVNIYDLGLIYEIHLNDDREAKVIMTLTAPNCPSAGEIPPEVEAKVRSVPHITGAQVDLVWEPAWNKDMMSDVARLELGM